MTLPTFQINQGHVLDVLRTMPSESVHMVCTSPPYWGLRDYGTATWIDGDADCSHSVGGQVNQTVHRGAGHGEDFTAGQRPGVDASKCRKCGARRVDYQLGLESTPEAYVAAMVDVFREVKRVLRSDGTCWLNLGDSYAGSWGNYGGQNRGNGSQREIVSGSQAPQKSYDGLEGWKPPTANIGRKRPASGRVDGIVDERGQRNRDGNPCPPGLKAKDLVGIPWRVAFALQADGWWLRSDIIWSKPNPMPESVTDRPTKSHEYIFLLTKSAKYYYDAAAIAEPATRFDWAFETPTTPGNTNRNDGGCTQRRTDKQRGHGRRHAGFNDRWDAMERAEQCSGMRNKRSVWDIATMPFPEAHFATFPKKLVETCIQAGTSAQGVCGQCGAPYKRVTQTEDPEGRLGKSYHNHEADLCCWSTRRPAIKRRTSQAHNRMGHDLRV